MSLVTLGLGSPSSLLLAGLLGSATPVPPQDAVEIYWSVDAVNAPWSVDATNMQWSFSMSIEQSMNWFLGEDKVVIASATPPVNVTGWQFTLRIFSAPGGTTLLTIPNSGITVTDSVNGVLQIDISAAQNDNQGGLYYELRRTDSGNNTVLAYGPLTVSY